VQLAQAGAYTVLVTNGFGFALSSNAVLTVLGPPRIMILNLLGDGSLSLGGTGGAGQSYVLLTASNLNPAPIWSPIQTNQADSNGWFQFTDPGVTSRPQRFYRIAQ